MRAGGPALLFERVKGSRFPLLINTYATRRRMSWALGVDDLDEHARTIGDLVKSQPPVGLMDKIRMLPKLARVAGAMPKTVRRRRPARRSSRASPDLGKLPIITTWPDDGGPYITLPMVITRDPDKGTRNVGCYRMQVYGPRETAMHWQLHKTGRRHMRRYQELGQQRMPVAVALGGDPDPPLRGDGAAARRHRRVHVRRLPAPQAGRDGRAARPSTSRCRRRPTSSSRATSTSTSCAARARSATTPATTRWPTTTRSST